MPKLNSQASIIMVRPTVTSKSPESSLKKNNSFPKIKLNQDKKLKQAQSKLKFSCGKCDTKFATWWEIREHWLSSGHKTPEQCVWCKKKTYTLQSHLCKQHWNVASMCEFCGQLFMFREDLEAHALQHDGSVFRCFQCGRRRKSKNLLLTHMYSHFLNEKYGCNICEKRFKKKKNLEQHLKVIHFICQYCGNTCNDLRELKKHYKVHDDLKCVLCQKVFSQKNRLKYHYQLRHGHQDFYKCTLCYQRFARKTSLLDHMKLKHHGISNFSCEICTIPFLYWQHYVNHFEKVHVKDNKVEDIFSCSFCDFETNLKCKLKWHVEKTSGTGFFCKKCQLQLQCRGRFEKHMKDHGDERVWTCDHCPRNYSSADVLKNHITMKHRDILMAENPQGYPCLEPNCEHYYTSKSSLNRHLRKNHAYKTTRNIDRALPVTSQTKTSRFQQKLLNLKENLAKIGNPAVKQPSNEDSQLVSDASKTTEVSVYSCGICDKYWFTGAAQFQRHMSSHMKTVYDEKCEDCEVILESPEEAVKHFVENHLKAKFIV